MLSDKPRQRKCNYCKEKFTPYNSFQKFCFKNECIKAHNRTETARKARKAKIQHKSRDKSIQLKLAQSVVNQYVRLRDENKPCISCGTTNAKWDAGHFFSQGGNSSIRYNTLNIHKQCFRCNRMLSANLDAYRPQLLKKIGDVNLRKLEDKRNDIAKYDVEYLHRLIKVFRKKIKLYKTRRDNVTKSNHLKINYH